MKNYTITVNGNVYEVTVEEGFTGAKTAPPCGGACSGSRSSGSPGTCSRGGSGTGCGSGPRHLLRPPYRRQPPAPAPAAAPAGAKGSVEITAPMPGKILGVKASAGQAVKRARLL